MKMVKFECGIEDNLQDLCKLTKLTQNGQVVLDSNLSPIFLLQVLMTIQSKFGTVAVVSQSKICTVRRKKCWLYNGWIMIEL